MSQALPPTNPCSLAALDAESPGFLRTLGNYNGTQIQAMRVYSLAQVLKFSGGPDLTNCADLKAASNELFNLSGAELDAVLLFELVQLLFLLTSQTEGVGPNNVSEAANFCCCDMDPNMLKAAEAYLLCVLLNRRIVL